jgi:type I restriction enzyme S subunit
MKKYDNSKDSGIAWIGEIPMQWNVKKAFYHFKAEKGKKAALLTKEYCGTIEGIYPVYSGQTENKGIMSLIDEYEFDFSDDGCLLSTTVGAKAMSVSYLTGKFSLSQNCMVITSRNKNEIDNRFFFYQFQPIFKFHRGLIPDHIQPSFRMDDLYQFKIITPSKEEQTQIANYLDQKTTQIDQLINQKKRFIELLQEERTAVINQAVTKGLDPTFKMKDSGIEWLGEIPEHWKSYRIDWVTNIVRGNTGFKKDELLASGEYVALQYGKTYKVDIVDDSFNFFVNSEFYKESQIVSKGDTILISTSETIEDLGHTCYYDKEQDGLLGGEQILLKPNQKLLFEKYLYHYAKRFCVELKQYAKGLKVFRFNTNDLKSIFIAIPKIEEQIQIANFIDLENNRIDTAIGKMFKEIVLLKEYKTALISEVVTGKVDVREEVKK